MTEVLVTTAIGAVLLIGIALCVMWVSRSG
jgi:hypothetical protein